VLGLALWAVKTVGDGRRRQETEGVNAPAKPLPSPTVPYRPLPPALFAISAFYLLRMPETLILLRTQEIGVSVTSVLLLWAALHVVRSSTSFVGGALSDRIGPSRTMWLGWISYTAIAVGFSLAASPVAAWVLFLAFGLVAGLTESPERALVSRLAGGKQGTGFGVYHGATGVAALAGGILLGFVYQSHSAGLAFLVSAVAATALVAAWPLLSRSTLKAE